MGSHKIYSTVLEYGVLVLPGSVLQVVITQEYCTVLEYMERSTLHSTPVHSTWHLE